MSNSIVEQALRAARADQVNSHQDILAKHQKIAEEFEESLKNQQALQDIHLSLSDYLAAVKLVIDDSFDHEVWVRAEIRSLHSKGGHYYFELAEKDDDDNITASCRATLWRYRANTVLAKFTATTGQKLAAGASILIECSASFHAQYGFSLNISDIDPNYTLGEIAAAYQAMKKRLIDEGLINLNKQLPTPFDIENVIVIAPEQAAGLGDFRAEADRLMRAGACQFHYHHATFQGNHAPSEIRAAITTSLTEFVENHQKLPDILVIIRGGGAVGDLAYLNDYELAALIAECPVPVWVGVGHERDQVILDLVAHTSFDTPSKVVLGIESHLAQITSQAKSTMEYLHKKALDQLNLAKNNSQRHFEKVRLKSLAAIALAKKDTAHELKQFSQTIKHQHSKEKLKTYALMKSIHQHSITQLTHAKHQSTHQLHRHHSVESRLQVMRDRCAQLQRLILTQHPKHTLQKGYAIIYNDVNQPIKSASMLKADDRVRIQWQDGSVSARIESVHSELF